MDKARKLPPAPPVKPTYEITDTPFRSVSEARRDAQEGRRIMDDLRDRTLRASLWAFSWLQRGGPELVGPAIPIPAPPDGVRGYRPLPEYERGVQWAAREIGVRDHKSFYRLAALGAIRNLFARARIPEQISTTTSDRVIGSLTALLPASTGRSGLKPDRSDQIAPAFKAAIDEAGGTPTASQVRAQVDRILGRTQPDPVDVVLEALNRLLSRIQQWEDTHKAETALHGAITALEEYRDA